MTIAIIGWGSLIWKPQDLPYTAPWKTGGPQLPLEFSRITEQRPLTIVLDPIDGVLCPTRFAFSTRTELVDAVNDLKQREGTTADQIGYVDLQRDRRSIDAYPQQIKVHETIWQWCQTHDIAAAVWTALPPNFTDQHGVAFSIENAIRFLKALPDNAQASTLEYVRNTPAEIVTPLRQRIESAWSD